MLLIVAGTTLFLMAGTDWTSLASGTHKLPTGVQSFVQRADYFSAQSSVGLTLIGLGIAVGMAASIRHALRRRVTAPRPPPNEHVARAGSRDGAARDSTLPTSAQIRVGFVDPVLAAG